MLCGDCMEDMDAIRVAGELVVVIEDDRLFPQRMAFSGQDSQSVASPQGTARNTSGK